MHRLSPTTAAAVCDGAGGLAPAELPLPALAAGDVLLRLRCAGLCGTDLWKLRHGACAPGTVLGHEVVGTVEAIGGNEGHGLPRPGERVVAVHHVPCGTCRFCREGSETMCPAFRSNLLAPGGFSERLVVCGAAVRGGVYRLPAELTDEAAVFLEPAACVLRGMRRACLLTSDCAALAGCGSAPEAPERGASRPRQERRMVAILGAGSMGLLHLLVLRALAAASAAAPPPLTVVSDPLPERRALALRLGADAAAAPGGDMREAVQGVARGGGADLVFDTVGGAGPLAEALALGRAGSAVVLFAHAAAAAEEAAGLPLNAFFKAERRLVATYSSAPPEQGAALRLLASGRLDPRPLVSHRLPLARAAEAVSLAAAQRALKVLLVPSAPDARSAARPAAGAEPAVPSASAGPATAGAEPAVAAAPTGEGR